MRIILKEKENTMLKSVILLVSTIILSTSLLISQKNSADDYINQWKDVAVEQMHEYGIPASITMAQGILESSYGNSMLATKANNHFGIKCHDWDGASVFKDDDKKNECFRKYNNARESFKDHSIFLSSRSRYSFLFELSTTDYKGWAKGLKKAGYATNPKYPKLLIELIERYELDKLDDIVEINFDEIAVTSEKPKSIENERISLNTSTTKKNDERQVLVNRNKTKYIEVRNGDTFYQIAEEFGLTLRQLHKYNDFPKTKDVLAEGDLVYLMPKKRKAKKTNQQIEIQEEKELWEVSQKYGIRLKSLIEINNLSADNTIENGDVLRLR